MQIALAYANPIIPLKKRAIDTLVDYRKTFCLEILFQNASRYKKDSG